MRFFCVRICAVITSILLLTTTACSQFQKKEKFIPFDEIKKSVADVNKIDFTDRKNFESFLNSITQDLIVAKKQGKVQPDIWAKIGQALDAYKSLLHIRDNHQILIPGKTNLKMRVTSFCIDPNRSSPESNEVFEWILGEPPSPLSSKVLKYYSSHPEVGQASVQELIWNLSNKTYYENYPNHLKNLLNKIDSETVKQLPSATRHEAIEIGTSIAEDIGGTDLRGLIHFIQGQYYEYEQFRKNVEGLQSSYGLPDKPFFSKIPKSDILATSLSDGYRNQILNFYNFSDTLKTVDPSEYYLNPLRKDVQRIALASIIGDPSYFINRLEQFFKRTLAELGVLYPNLTDEEKLLIRKHPYESLRVAWHQARSEFAMGRFFEGGSIDGEADAFRHFVWAGFLTHDLGKNLAEQYLNAHESGQPLNFPDRRIDEHNNRKGIEAALNLDQQDRFSAKNLYQEAFKSLKNKDLIVLKPTGEIPDDSSY